MLPLGNEDAAASVAAAAAAAAGPLGASGEGGDAVAVGQSSLDFALLESIFYNEMMLLDDSTSSISSSLLSTLAADGSVQSLLDASATTGEGHATVPATTTTSVATTAATTATGSSPSEEPVLTAELTPPELPLDPPQPQPSELPTVTYHDGVTSSKTAAPTGETVRHVGGIPPPDPTTPPPSLSYVPPPPPPPPASTPPPQQPAYALPTTPPTTSAVVPSAAVASHPYAQPPPATIPITTSQTSRLYNTAVVGAHLQQPTFPTAPPSAVASTTSTAAVTASVVAVVHPPPVTGSTVTTTSGGGGVDPQLSSAPTGATTATAPQNHHHSLHVDTSDLGVDNKREKLASQFASLASRLGINLPESVLHALSSLNGGGKSKGSTNGSTAEVPPTAHAATAGVDPAVPVVGSEASPTTLPPAAVAHHPTHAVAAVAYPQHASVPTADRGYAVPHPPPPVPYPTPPPTQPHPGPALAPTHQQQPLVQPPPPVQQLRPALPANAGAPVADFESIATSSFGQQLASTADAAIAAASRKRSHMDLQEADDVHAMAAAAGTTGKQPAYSKRRKKPSLSDCEAKLAELKAENSMLKRHLANVSSQSHLLEQERHTQEARMRQMLANRGSVSQEEMNQAVQTFTDMYSDYGRRRHQELTFHLQQLQRLANPTNSTKMGLFTMGQQSKNTSRNSIAGILQKELDISGQQGKKIFEQRERIREVCNSLKECLTLLSKLKALCAQKTQIFHDRLTRCREILLPEQVVRLVLWIHDNSSTLEAICPGWGSETVSAAAARHAS